MQADHEHDDKCQSHDHDHQSPLLVELREHVPFSVSAVAIGLIVAGVICILGSGFGVAEPAESHASHTHEDHSGHGHDDHSGHGHEGHEHPPAVDESADGHDHDHGPAFARQFFHLFHPAHMLFSAAATAAMFCRYERKHIKGILVGLIGAVGVCGISDIAMPQFSLWILGVQTEWHICVVEEPGLVLPFAVVGVLIGAATAGQGVQTTIYSHSLHVLASTMASIFYMVGPIGVTEWMDVLGKVFLFIVIAVMVPCCLSDIVFPMLMSRSAREQYAREPHAH